MKKFFVYIFFILIATAFQYLPVNAKQCVMETSNCSELIEKIRSQKNTLYNVLSLSPEQQAIKDEIEQRRVCEMQPLIDEYHAERQKLNDMVNCGCSKKEYRHQKKITVKAHNNIHKAFKRYDKEFVKILCPLQKSKYREINKLVKRDIKYCRLNKRCCPKNPYVNTFGKQDAKYICPKCK